MDALTLPASPAGTHPRFGAPALAALLDASPCVVPSLPASGPRCDHCGEAVIPRTLPELGYSTWCHLDGFYSCDAVPLRFAEVGGAMATSPEALAR